MGKKLTNNLLLKIGSLAFASILWILVVNIDDPIKSQVFSHIEVDVLNPEAITSHGRTFQILDNTKFVNVTVSAKTSVLDKITSADIVAEADMKELTYGSYITIKVTIPSFSGQYEQATAQPPSMRVNIEGVANNTFPITPTTNGAPRDGFMIGSLKVNPEKVSVNGPQSVVERIHHIAAPVDVTGLSEERTIETELVYYDAENRVIDGSLLDNNLGEKGVSVEVVLLKVRSVPISFDTSEIQVRDGYSLGVLTYEPKEIRIAGSNEAMEGLTKIIIPSEALAMRDVYEKEEVTVDISPFLPEGIRLADENANTVVVTIPVEEYGTRSIDFSVGSISVENGTQGMTWNYGDVTEIEIRVRGAQEILDRLTLEPRDVIIDLLDMKEPGTFAVPVNVILPTGLQLVEPIEVEITLVGTSLTPVVTEPPT